MSDFEKALGAPRLRYNPVAAAYEGMDAANQAAFRTVIQNDEYSHAQIAEALRTVGYDIDRKQVQAFREKLALGKVTL